MENEPNDAPQVETVAASPAPAPAPSTTSTEAPASPLSSFDDDQIEASFQSRNEPPSDPADGEVSERTEEQAHPATSAVEQPTEQIAPLPPTVADEDEPDQIRVRLKGENATIFRMAREKGISIAEAADLYRGRTAPAAPAISEAGRDAAEPTAMQKLESDIDALANEIEAERAGGEGEYLAAAHLRKTERLAELRNDLRFAQFRQEQENTERQRSEVQAVQQAVATSFDAARAEFPTIAAKDSALTRAAAAVETEWQANPTTAARLARPDAPLMLAREAAERVAADLVNAGKFRTLDLAIASLKAPPAPAAAPTVPTAPPPAPTQQQRRVAPAPGVRTQAAPAQPQTSAALLSQVGFDPEAADEALYGHQRPTALGR